MSTPESRVKDRVREVLRDHGAYYVQPVTGGYGASGAPDILTCVYGVFLGVEVKAGRNKPTELQKQNLRAIQAAGGVACVVNETNVTALADLCQYIRQGHRHDEWAPVLPAGITLADEIPDIALDD